MFKDDQLIEDTASPVEKPTGLQIKRHFMQSGIHPFDTVAWERRDAKITDVDGKIIFEQKYVEFPQPWSQQATNIVASKYFRGQLGTPQREKSVKEMVLRVANAIKDHGIKEQYFDEENANIFANELLYILIHQIASFNSPVWFNIGVPNIPRQAGACFTLDVEDSLASIFEWYTTDGKIFSHGSGSGINVSKLRGKDELLSGGGKSSGSLSFVSVADKSSGVIKSGGLTRRSARMIILNVDHPDIEDFIECKVHEDKKARTLVQAGFDASLDGDVYATVAYQNANHSVGVSDAFMCAVVADGKWTTRFVTTNEIAKEHTARDLFNKIAEATWSVGDPGMQFHDTMNAWHTTPSAGRIELTNPCSEFVRPPNECCNLSSINLLKFLRADNSFDIQGFCHTADIMTIAMEILVDYSDYPTQAITENSHRYRTVGLGYTNLGALLMTKGFPYDSDEGREYAASITALMTGRAYRQSTVLASVKGAFAGFELDREAMLGVIDKHISKLPEFFTNDLWHAAWENWKSTKRNGALHGFRNAQVSLLAPTGTIAFLMDCQTTGVEPDIALVKYKKLVGGGTLKMINSFVPLALRNLGYSEKTIQDNCEFIEKHGSFDNISDMWLKPEHRAIFDCAFPTSVGGRSIAWEGHVKMVAAVQPFLSGGVSKSINMPNDATVEDVERAYMMAWELGLKSIAIYRNGCKFQQPVTTQQTEALEGVVTLEHAPLVGEQVSVGTIGRTFNLESVGAILDDGQQPKRRRLPDERKAITQKFSIGGVHEGYITVGLYEDGTPGEIFLKMAKEGSTISGLMDTIATLTSVSLQYGVPLKALVTKFSHMRFEPAGFTQNKNIPVVSSVVDFVFRWLEYKFLTTATEVISSHGGAITDVRGNGKTIDELFGQQDRSFAIGGFAVQRETNTISKSSVVQTYERTQAQTDGLICPECGSLCIRSGSCSTCPSCGFNSGCSG